MVHGLHRTWGSLLQAYCIGWGTMVPCPARLILGILRDLLILPMFPDLGFSFQSLWKFKLFFPMGIGRLVKKLNFPTEICFFFLPLKFSVVFLLWGLNVAFSLINLTHLIRNYRNGQQWMIYTSKKKKKLVQFGKFCKMQN